MKLFHSGSLGVLRPLPVADTHSFTLSESRPKSSCCRNPVKAVLIRLAVSAAIALQKKVCQQMVLVQNELRSSIAKSRPPIGALKPAATPAATPAVVKDRLWKQRQEERS